jgi:hypothetical protein
VLFYRFYRKLHVDVFETSCNALACFGLALKLGFHPSTTQAVLIAVVLKTRAALVSGG